MHSLHFDGHASAGDGGRRMTDAYGTRTPGWLDRTVIAVTSRLPEIWLGLRRISTMRLTGDDGLDVVHWGLRLRLHPRRNGCEKGALFTPQMYEIPRAEGIVRGHRQGQSSQSGVSMRVMGFALDESAATVALEIDHRDKGGTYTRPLSGGEPAGTGVECRPPLDVLHQEGAQYIDALKINVEGMEDRILIPFFNDAPQSLWPGLVIEDTRDPWNSDLFFFLAERGCTNAQRSKLNTMMRRLAT